MIRKWLGIDKIEAKAVNQSRDISGLEVRTSHVESFIRENTTAHVDAPFSKHGSCQVVLIGKYGNTELVEIIHFTPRDFQDIVGYVRSRRVRVGFVDAPAALRVLIKKA